MDCLLAICLGVVRSVFLYLEFGRECSSLVSHFLVPSQTRRKDWRKVWVRSLEGALVRSPRTWQMWYWCLQTVSKISTHPSGIDLRTKVTTTTRTAERDTTVELIFVRRVDYYREKEYAHLLLLLLLLWWWRWWYWWWWSWYEEKKKENKRTGEDCCLKYLGTHHSYGKKVPPCLDAMPRCSIKKRDRVDGHVFDHVISNTDIM